MSLRILVVTSEWPSPEHPHQVPFIVQQVRFLRERGLEVSVFAFRGGKSPLNYLRARRELRRAHDLRDYDLIHMHFGQSSLLVYPVTTPTVVTFWGSDVHGIVNHHGQYSRFSVILRAVSRWASHKADAVIVVSARMKTLLGAPTQARILPHGVDLTLFKPIPQRQARSRLGLTDHTQYILFAANENRPVKRIELAREAVTLVNTRHPCELLTITNATHEDMPWWMNAADCLLLTSRHEGSPTVVKEALACGLPVVSVDVGDVAEQLAGISGCRICKSDSPNAVADALLDVFSARQRVRVDATLTRRLDEKSAIEALIELYQHVAGKHYE